MSDTAQFDKPPSRAFPAIAIGQSDHESRPDLQLSPAGHGVAGVDREIDDHLFEERRIDPCEPGFAIELHPELDVVTDDPGEHPFEAQNQLVDVDHLGV